MGVARMFRRLQSCNNVEDMRRLAKQRLPGPIFHYIDGAADDEVTYRRNTTAFEECDAAIASGTCAPDSHRRHA